MRAARKWAALAGIAFVLAVGASAANEKVTWKPLPEAILRIDDSPPKQWNLYAAGKKADPLLLQYGKRALLIYVQQQKVYEIAPAKLQPKGDDLQWLETDRPSQPLATSDWSVRDVGSAFRIRMTLSAERHVVDIQLPEELNNRVLF